MQRSKSAPKTIPFSIPENLQTGWLKEPVIPEGFRRELDSLPKYEWQSSNYWRQEVRYWKKWRQPDLVSYCSFLAQQWKEYGLAHDENALKLRSTVSGIVHCFCKARRELAENGLLHPERKDFAFYLLTWLYRQKFTHETPGFVISPEELPGYETARESAKAACWKAAGKDCLAFWEQRYNDLLIQGGFLNDRKAPSKRIRRKDPFDKNPTVFVIGNWIRCYLWLMTPEVRLSFVNNYSEAKISFEALSKIVKRGRLYCDPASLIIGFTNDGKMRLRTD